MSADAENSDETASGRADGDVTPGVRRRGERILETDPGLSPAAFAGRLFAELNTSPDVATDLYADLVDDTDAGLSGAHEGGSDERAESRAESDPMPAPGETPDRDEHDESGSEGRRASDANTEPADDVAALIEDHYDRLEGRDVYATLGELAPGVAGTDTALSCIGNYDFYGWYRDRNGEARAHALSKEFDIIRESLDRVVYATPNYAPPSWFMDAWKPFEWVEDESGGWERVFDGDKPTPEYDAVHAYAPFADIDLTTAGKKARAGHTDICLRAAGPDPATTAGVNADGTGFPKALHSAIEEALHRYIDAFADLAGGREHVYALDSVGGAYLFVAPTATAPIATAFDDADDRADIFEELTDRLNDWLDDVAERVTDATDLAGVFEPDLLNNKNRLYKAPLSVHTSLDGVVTPVDVADPTYQFTPLEETSGELVDETRAWVDGFTADHRDAVDAIVATLWPEHYGAADDWRDALAAWLEDHREKEERNQERERQRIPSDEIPDDLETTDDLEVINSKIEGIAVDDLIRDTIGAAVEGEDTDDGDDGVRFDPPWRGSKSGQSCFADSVKFYDPDASYSGGGALEFIAAERGIVSRPGDKLTGNKYWRAVNALRDEGCNIPYYEGSNGRHPDVLRLFTEPDGQEEKKKQLARALFADR